jgi:hypothetical protein
MDASGTISFRLGNLSAWMRGSYLKVRDRPLFSSTEDDQQTYVVETYLQRHT